jgi:hypothetical protein
MKAKSIFIKIIISIILIFLSYNLSFADKYIVDTKIQKIFSSFTKKLENKYTIKKEISYLENLNQKITLFLDK